MLRSTLGERIPCGIRGSAERRYTFVRVDIMRIGAILGQPQHVLGGYADEPLGCEMGLSELSRRRGSIFLVVPAIGDMGLDRLSEPIKPRLYYIVSHLHSSAVSAEL